MWHALKIDIQNTSRMHHTDHRRSSGTTVVDFPKEFLFTQGHRRGKCSAAWFG